jgi:hypothetical protein
MLEAPPTVPAVPRGFDEAGVREAVETYAKVFSTLDPAAVRNVYPTIPSSDLRALDSFRKDVRGYRMTVLVTRVRLDNTRAILKCSVFHNGISAEGRRINQSREEDWEFRWDGQRWLRTK